MPGTRKSPLLTRRIVADLAAFFRPRLFQAVFSGSAQSFSDSGWRVVMLKRAKPN
jgi:hypothetical protein